MSEQERRQWHLDKRLNVGHLLTTIIIASYVFWWVVGTERTFEKQSQDIEHTREIVALQQRFIEQQVVEMKQAINTIDSKIDHLMEK